MIDHERIGALLLTRFKQKLGGRVKHFTRQFETFDQIAAELQPALVQTLVRAIGDSAPGTPTRWTLHFAVVMLVRNATEDKTKTAETEMNTLLTAVSEALKRQDDEPPMKDPEHTSLGEQVEYAFINGPVEYSQGEAGEQSFMIIPIEVLVVP